MRSINFSKPIHMIWKQKMNNHSNKLVKIQPNYKIQLNKKK